MRFLLISCTLWSLVASAQGLTASDREQLDLKMAASAYTLEQRELPITLGNALKLNQNLSHEDRVLVSQALTEWPKSYSRDVHYLYGGTRWGIVYKGIPVVSFQVLQMEPRTILINQRSKVILKEGSEISSVLGALEKLGYRFPRLNVAALNFSLFPSAWAQNEDPGLTIENSIIMSAATVLAPDQSKTLNIITGQATKYTKALIKQGYLFPTAGLGYLKSFFWERNRSCNGETASGSIVMGNHLKADVHFEASRAGGVIFEFDGYKVIGKATHPGENGGPVQGSCRSLNRISDSGSFDAKLSAIKRNCDAIKKVKPESSISCDFTKNNYRKLCAQMDAMTIIPPIHFQLCRNAACTSTVPIDANDTVNSAIHKMKFEKWYKKSNFAAEEKRLDRLQEGGVRLSKKDKAEIAEILDIEVMMTGGSNDFGGAAAAAMGLLDCCSEPSCRQSLKNAGMNLEPKDESNAVE